MKFPEVPSWLRTRLMFALIITAAVAFGVRFNDLLNQPSAQDQAFMALNDITPAAGEPAKAQDGKTEVIKAADTAPSQKALPGESETKPAQPASPAAAPAKDWKDASDSDIEYSAVQMQLFEDLTKRRTELEARDKELLTREALLKAAERNLEQKYKELNDLRTEVKDLLVQQNEEEQARITSLVKIYEGMKAKDAARIFDTLDMDVLLQVVGRMSARKTSPIIAAMNPERARSVTIMLAEQKALPTLDNDLSIQ